MERTLKISLLGLAHGLSDCAAGFMIGMLPSGGAEPINTSAAILLYNVLAFGGQVPAGMVVDALGKPKLALAISMGLMAAALLSFGSLPLLAICLAGLSSAFFHVAGGMLALLAYPDSAMGAGLFAAPGVMGLAIGGYMAWQGLPVFWVLTLLALGMMSLIIALDFPKAADSTTQTASPVAQLDWHDLIMLVLLMAIGLRSAVWNLFQLIHAHDHALLLVLAATAMLGKVGGGFFANLFGWRRYSVVALMVATPLLLLGETQPYALIPGIFLLQSATPAAVMGMYRLMPRLPATAIGLCFGMAIAVGGIPAAVGWDPHGWLMAVVLVAAAGGYWLGMRRQAAT